MPMYEIETLRNVTAHCDEVVEFQMTTLTQLIDYEESNRRS